MLALPVLGCHGPSEAAPNGAAAPSATPAGYQRHTTEGWSIAVPTSYSPRAPRHDTGDMVWLTYVGDVKAPGAPAVLFARYARPVEFPSRIYGLTVLEQLRREPQKRVVTSSQHAAAGLEVTDLEVAVADEQKPRHQWRRVFVDKQQAYLITVSVAETEAAGLRATAETVIASLARE